MAKDIEPKLLPIKAFLALTGNQHFVIPEYQRAYSWAMNAQCDKLWQDIKTYMGKGNGDDPYFFGTIIEDCSNDSQGEFHLIDGQQRTTTFLLLLKAILFRINEALPNIPKDDDNEPLLEGLKERRKQIMSILYKIDAESIPSYIKDPSKCKGIKIIENRSINENYKDEMPNILGAKDFTEAEASVIKLYRKQKDNKYTNYFRNLKFFYEQLGDKPTEINCFAKTVLEKCQIIQIRSWQVEQAIEMFNSLNSTGMPLSDADIISAHLYSKAGDDKRKDFQKLWSELIEILKPKISGIEEIVRIDSVLQQYMYIHRALSADSNVTTPGLRRYYTELQKNLLNDPIDLVNKFIKIARIWDKVKDYTIVKLLLKQNENIKLFLMGYLFRFDVADIDEKSIMNFCKCLLRLFTLLEVDDKGYSSNFFKSFLFKENVKFVDGTVDISCIKADFDKHISDHWDRTDVYESILEYDGNLLVFLNDYLFSQEKGLPFSLSTSINIEHIMPQSGSNIVTIRNDAGLNEEDFKIVVNKLGNKILLEETINKSIGNEWFKTKKQSSVKDKLGYKDSIFPIASKLTEYPSDLWTKDDIDKATEKAAQRITEFIFDCPLDDIKDDGTMKTGSAFNDIFPFPSQDLLSDEENAFLGRDNIIPAEVEVKKMQDTSNLSKSNDIINE